MSPRIILRDSRNLNANVRQRSGHPPRASGFDGSANQGSLSIAVEFRHPWRGPRQCTTTRDHAFDETFATPRLLSAHAQGVKNADSASCG